MFREFNLISGWWYTYPSEQYEFVNWEDEIPKSYGKIYGKIKHVPKHQPDIDLISSFNDQKTFFASSISYWCVRYYIIHWSIEINVSYHPSTHISLLTSVPATHRIADLRGGELHAAVPELGAAQGLQCSVEADDLKLDTWKTMENHGKTIGKP